MRIMGYPMVGSMERAEMQETPSSLGDEQTAVQRRVSVCRCVAALCLPSLLLLP